jgi:hypothetical protein
MYIRPTIFIPENPEVNLYFGNQTEKCFSLNDMLLCVEDAELIFKIGHRAAIVFTVDEIFDPEGNLGKILSHLVCEMHLLRFHIGLLTIESISDV